jgi:hypothetical protein
MPRGIPRRVSDAWEAEQAAPMVRVVVYLERRAIEDLQLLVRYRHGAGSRSEIVREAVLAMRAREAAYLVRARRWEERRRREAAERDCSRSERDQLAELELVAEAVRIASGGD